MHSLRPSDPRWVVDLAVLVDSVALAAPAEVLAVMADSVDHLQDKAAKVALQVVDRVVTAVSAVSAAHLQAVDRVALAVKAAPVGQGVLEVPEVPADLRKLVKT